MAWANSSTDLVLSPTFPNSNTLEVCLYGFDTSADGRSVGGFSESEYDRILGNKIITEHINKVIGDIEELKTIYPDFFE